MAKITRRIVFVLCAAIFILFIVLNTISWKDKIGRAIIRPSIVKSLHATSWSKYKEKFPIGGLRTIPPLADGHVPRIQAQFGQETYEAMKLREHRLNAVREAFTHTWTGYKIHAWGKDEIKPTSGGFRNDTFGGWGATLVDSLDTLWLMNMYAEFDEAIDVVLRVDFTTPRTQILNVFETTIRYLGGLISAYDLSGRQELLVKAVELGNMLYAAFDTHNRMPVSRWNWSQSLQGHTQVPPEYGIAAEVGSLQLEFTRLSQISDNPKYYDAVARVNDVFKEQQFKTRLPGLWPVQFSSATKDSTAGHVFSLGAMVDSLYEYLPKTYLLLNGVVSDHRKMYEAAIRTAKSTLFFRPMTSDARDILLPGITRVSATGVLNLSPEVEHLACFAGGMVALASKAFRLDDMDLARKLVGGCLWAYESMPSGIMPENFQAVPCLMKNSCPWDEVAWRAQALRPLDGNQELLNMEISLGRLPRGISSITNRMYYLRPEAIESVFIMYRLTGDQLYMEAGWRMFEAINRLTKSKYGHAALSDVSEPVPKQLDRMESFWTAETLKYFFLLFSDPNVISLDDWVLNTEAHPFRKIRSGS